MDISWQDVWVTYPVLARLSFWVSIFVLIGGYPLSRRNAFPLLISFLPVVLANASVWASLHNVAEGISTSGGGRLATTAGLAEAQFPLFIACVVTAIVAFALSVTKRVQASRSDLRLSLALLSFVGVSIAAEVTLVVAAHLSGDPQPLIRQTPSLPVFVVAAVTALIAACLVLIGFRARREVLAAARRFRILSAVSFVSAVGLWYLGRVLWQTALRGVPPNSA
jgi:hypothetical protein